MEDLIKSTTARILALRKSCFDVFVADLYVRSATEFEYEQVPKLERQASTFTTYLTFVLRTQGGRMSHTQPVRVTRMSHTLPVRVTRRFGSGEFDFQNPSIKWKDDWLTFDAFCAAVVRVAPLTTPVGDEGYNTLWRWYQLRNKPFRFLDLPMELRLIVYECVVGNDIYPRELQPGHSLAASLGNGWTPKPPLDILEGTHDPADVVPPPMADIMSLSRGIRAEAARVVWGSSRQSFAEPAVLGRLAALQVNLPANALTHIRLNFTNYDYLGFFIDAPEAELFRGKTLIKATILQPVTLPNLDRLDLTFRSTCWNANYWPSPWDWQGFDFVISNVRSICQKLMTEMLLGLAFKYVRHIPKVSIQGPYVKASTRAAFIKALEELKQDMSKEEPDGWTVNKGDFISEMDFRTLKCSCRRPCGFGGEETFWDQYQNQPPSRRESLEDIFAKYTWDDQD